MAIVLEDFTAATVDDGDSYTVIGTGSNRILLTISAMTDNATGGTVSALTLNAVALTNVGGLLSAGVGSPWVKNCAGVHLDGVAASGVFDIAISTTYANDTTIICELSGVDQTTPLGDQVSAKEQNALSAPVTMSCSDGDMVFNFVIAASAVTISPDSVDLGATDAWVTDWDNITGMGGGIDSLSCYHAIATGNYTDIDIEPTISATDVIANYVVVVKIDSGSTGRIMGSIAGPGGLAGHGGIAGRSGGMAG